MNTRNTKTPRKFFETAHLDNDQIVRQQHSVRTVIETKTIMDKPNYRLYFVSYRDFQTAQGPFKLCDFDSTLLRYVIAYPIPKGFGRATSGLVFVNRRGLVNYILRTRLKNDIDAVVPVPRGISTT